MTMDGANVCLGVRNLRAGAGGISRVARLMARAVGDLSPARPKGARILALDHSPLDRFAGLPVTSSRGSALRFVTGIQRAQGEHTHFLYDELSMARAHTVFRGRRPALAFVHGVEIWEEAIPNRLRCARRLDAMVTNTAYTRERAHRLHGGFEDVPVCWLGTEDDGPPAAPPAFDGPPVVLMVGRLHAGRDKGHRALIDAWPAVVSRHRRAELHIAGGGNDEAALKAYAARCGVASRIRFLGFMPDDRLDDAWRSSWIFAMPSRGEGFGLVYIEAMRHGVPVIGSIHDAAPEINMDGDTGYNVDLGRSGELEERLVHLLDDAGRCREMGLRGMGRWSEHFTYRAFRVRFAAILSRFVQ